MDKDWTLEFNISTFTLPTERVQVPPKATLAVVFYLFLCQYWNKGTAQIKSVRFWRTGIHSVVIGENNTNFNLAEFFFFFLIKFDDAG